MLSLSLFNTGCYLGHLATGQAQLMYAERPIDEVMRDPATPASLRSQLETIQGARSYAHDLGLEVDEQYTSYVDWPGDRIVTTVVTTRPGEVTPAGFWFPLLGRLPYKGFFDRERAEAEAEKLRGKGFDVCVIAVSAYSTLGWLNDPVTAPMLRGGEGRTVETIFHELVHATVYTKDHVDFNETVASFIGQEASVQFYADTEGATAAETRRAAVDDSRALSAVLTALRDRIEALYQETEPGVEQERRREALENAAREELAGLALTGRDGTALAQTIRLNDACVALAGTYAAGIERYAANLAALGGNLGEFIARLRAAADAPDPAEALLAP
ncbi:MAG: aminopeptidase [Deltaproteobacteria bacterium]|nr:aminopeptidase [Deltaproteobacteria bacterium]MBW2665639.1 aminopeptidase [Deltaproteobacteria bacterium]